MARVGQAYVFKEIGWRTFLCLEDFTNNSIKKTNKTQNPMLMVDKQMGESPCN
jgi:hypothetical protein